MLWMLTGVHINQRPAPKKKQQLHRNGHNVWYGPVSKFSLPCTFHCSRSRPHFIESDQQISIFICSSPPTSIDGVTLVSRTAIKRFTSSNSIQWIFFPDRDALNDERGRQDICNSNFWSSNFAAWCGRSWWPVDAQWTTSFGDYLFNIFDPFLHILLKAVIRDTPNSK